MVTDRGMDGEAHAFAKVVRTAVDWWSPWVTALDPPRDLRGTHRRALRHPEGVEVCQAVMPRRRQGRGEFGSPPGGHCVLCASVVLAWLRNGTNVANVEWITANGRQVQAPGLVRAREYQRDQERLAQALTGARAREAQAQELRQIGHNMMRAEWAQLYRDD